MKTMEKDNHINGLQWNEVLCSGSQKCISRCAFGALTFQHGTLQINADLCRMCGACVKACPSGALTLPDKQRQPISDNKGGIWVLIEEHQGKIAPVSLELLGKAVELNKTLHETVEAVLVGSDVSSLVDGLIAAGADRVHLLEHPIFTQYIEEHYVAAVAHLAEKSKPGIILVGATAQGRGISARLAGCLKTGLTADCTDLSIASDRLLLQRRPAFGGNLMATIVTPVHRPQMASVRAGVMKAMKPDYQRKGDVLVHDLSSFVFDERIQLVQQIHVERNNSINLENSRIIIGIGRGVKPSLLPEIQALAEKIGATVAGSRAAVEAGLIDASLQIGQTGHTIAADVYIALGISGQIQHVSALGATKQVIAVNRDPQAPIFRYADWGWVGTIEEALPVLEKSFIS